MGIFDDLFGRNSGGSAQNKMKTTGDQKPSASKEYNEEISVDIETFLHDNDIIAFSNQGVRLHRIPDMVRVEYDGELPKNGAQQVTAVIGYGDNDNWQDVGEFPMQKTSGNKFELVTVRKRPGHINMAFKDGANNWDNNSGLNYVFYDEAKLGGH